MSPERETEDHTHAHMDMALGKDTANENTLANRDTGITQAFNKLFVEVKVEQRPLRKKAGGGETKGGRAGECGGMRGEKHTLETHSFRGGKEWSTNTSLLCFSGISTLLHYLFI